MAAGFIDARTDDAPASIEASVCIVGAGAAGITLARTLSETMSDVVLVESGGFDLEGETQNLFAGESTGIPYFNLTACRLRYWGGTTNHWSGYCRPNDPIDYRARPSLALPGWPVAEREIMPYVNRAAQSLGISERFFEVGHLLSDLHEEPTLADDASDILSTKVFQLAKHIRLGPLFREALGRSPNLAVYHHLNAVHIQLSGDGNRVDHVRCATLTGKQVEVRARQFVVCCHAIENARLLLASNDIRPNGIGNEADHVGRYFMEHIRIFASRFVPAPSFPAIYNREYARTKRLNVNLGLADKALIDNDILQYYCRFNPVYLSAEASDALSSVKDRFFEPGDLGYLMDVATVLGEFDGAARYEALKRLPAASYPSPVYYDLEHRLEQAPNPESRIVLSGRRDALGSRIADLHWAINEHDVRSFRTGQDLLVRELSALGYGRAELEDITPDLVRSRLAGNYHQIGTTRMSADPADGVVTPDGRVHDVANLFVAGSSVFPSAGYSGPTMMIIGMALRLADHLREKA